MVGRNTKASTRESTRATFSTKTSILNSEETASPRSSGMNKSKRTQPQSVRLSDLMAAMYPGVKVGHKYCNPRIIFVPSTMGWLWNTEDTATGVPFPRGWRPGAIALGVKKRIYRPRSVTEPMITPLGTKKKIKKKLVQQSSISFFEQKETLAPEIESQQPPTTLCVEKEGGFYKVKMHPINQTKKKGEEEEQPVQFKIAEDSSSSLGIKSSSSSIKIEYTCTGALRKPVVKPELAEMGTQWDKADFEVKTKGEEIKPKDGKKGKQDEVTDEYEKEQKNKIQEKKAKGKK